MEFKIGDVVMLKSGGPKMTIQNIGEFIGISHKEGLSCIWFEGAKKISDVFHPDSVESYKPYNPNVNVTRR